MKGYNGFLAEILRDGEEGREPGNEWPEEKDQRHTHDAIDRDGAGKHPVDRLYVALRLKLREVLDQRGAHPHIKQQAIVDEGPEKGPDGEAILA